MGRMEKKPRERILIFDTTLRDGEQSPGVSLNPQEKLRIAKQLERLGVDIIEAGFPVVSQGDFDAVKLIAKEIKDSRVVAMARAQNGDIDRAWEAVMDARKPGIHIFLSTSDIHLKYQMKKKRSDVIDIARKAVKRASSYTPEIEFSAMDATRTDPEFLCQIFQAVIDEGARTVNIADTVGYSLTHEFSKLVTTIRKGVPNIDKAILSVHCHNDLGHAVSNSIAGILAGARQVECTINGIGERAGNAALEEVVMAIETRQDLLPFKTGIRTELIYPTSRLVVHITGMTIQPNKAIVGANAFVHESGIHQDGVLKERSTYEIMTPKEIGLKDGLIVLGKHSGRRALQKKLQEMGYELSEEEMERVFLRFKKLADRKKEIFDDDLDAIVADEILRIPDKYKLLYLNVISGSVAVPTATVQIEVDGKVLQDAGFGIGPVDATYATIAKITGTKSRLIRFSINAVTGGTDAQGEVTVKLEEDGNVVVGQGTHPDIIMASAKAYINALNRLEYIKRHPGGKRKEEV
jgi:2-isopropylmalate synthase